MATAESSRYPTWFAELMARHILALVGQLTPKPHKSGMPAGFNETDLQRFLTNLSNQGTISAPEGCPPLLIERTLPNNSGTRIDYALARALPPANTDILATCEVKGPVRKTLFNPARLKGNFGRKIIKDTEYQLHRTTLFPKAEHYLALLVPLLATYTANCSVAQMLNCVQNAVPGARLREDATKSVSLPNGVDLTIVMVRVEGTAALSGLSYALSDLN